MKVILLENIQKIGSIGEIIEVKRGFARNYLISKKKALFASKENIKEVEKIKQDLNNKDEGVYECICCEEQLFSSSTKYDSGTGWPSFFESLPNVFETKTDNYLGYARTEYHCKNCGGHHGHIFEDGPKPTGKRYCNNGVCLVFRPK